MTLNPPPINGIHAWLFASACTCRRHGFSHNEAHAAIEHAAIGTRRPIPAREVSAAINDAFGITETRLTSRPPPRWARTLHPPTTPDADAPRYDAAAGWQGHFKPSTLPLFSPSALAALLDNVHEITCADLLTHSQTTHPTTRVQDVLGLLFGPDDLVCLGRDAKHSETRFLRDWQAEDLTAWQFVVPNPMRLKSTIAEAGYESTRCRATTGPRRYFIIESDQGLTLDEQATALWQMRDRVPCRLAAVVASGGKSLHGWFDCSELSEPEVADILGRFTRLGADPRLLCPEQFVRLPLGTRSSGATQRLLYLAPQRTTSTPAPTPAPAGLCPACWSRRVIAPINGPTCSCKPYNWPTWTPAQVEADAGR